MVPASKAFDNMTDYQRTCETARSRSTSAGTSNSRGSSNTDEYSVRVPSDSADLWSRFQESLAAAELELADISCEEKELTALLGELGFTAIERARLRRACQSWIQKTALVAPTLKRETEDGEIKEKHEEESRVNECVFLTGDFFGDDVGLMVSSVVAAGLESPSAQLTAAVPAFDHQPELPPTPVQTDENVFLTGDFFGDDVAVATNSALPITTAVERLSAIPPPPLASPLVHIQPQMPLAPPPAEAPALEQISSSQLPPSLQALQVPIAGPMQQPIPGSPELQMPIVGWEELPSIGSWEHHMGTCKPCAYFGERGCGNGAQCEYCHLCPPGELKRRQKARRSAQRRMRYMNASEL